MKTLFCVLLLVGMGTAAAKADEVTITLDQPTQTASVGDTVSFFGTITNLTDNTIYFNGDTLNPVTGLTLNDNFYAADFPFSVAPYATSADIDLFDATVDAAGDFSGSYSLVGGADGGTFMANDNLGSASFAVNAASPTPEPASIYLLLGGLVLWPVARRMRARA